jgi:zinc/manganese transport system permease protein
MVAVTAGIVGYFVVLRRSAFAAHALSHIGFAGAAGAVLFGISPVIGLLVFTCTGGMAMTALGPRARYKDAQIGIVLAFMLGLGVLFISLYKGYATEAYSILFGEILAISSSDALLTVAACIGIIAVVSVVYRPLLFTSLDENVAEAQGLPMLPLGVVFMLLVAVTTSFAVQVVGVLLIFSLMVTPAATAQHLAGSPRGVIIISVAIALASVWSGLYVALFFPYPVSFFITSIVFSIYLIVRLLHHKIGVPEKPEAPVASSRAGPDSSLRIIRMATSAREIVRACRVALRFTTTCTPGILTCRCHNPSR